MITGPCFLAPLHHLLTVALTYQSPLPNAMWQCWDYNICPILPGINAITVARPLGWATPALKRKATDQEMRMQCGKEGRRTTKIDEWIWENWRSSLAPVKGPYIYRERWGVFRSYCTAALQDAFKEELWLIAMWKANCSLDNDFKICISTSVHALYERRGAAVCYNNKHKGVWGGGQPNWIKLFS